MRQGAHAAQHFLAPGPEEADLESRRHGHATCSNREYLVKAAERKGTVMPEKGLATEGEIQSALKELPGWKQQGNALVKTYDLKGFKAAMAFVGTVGELAERADHHPDILIQFHKVTLTLSSHDKGGITDRDLRLARQIEAAAKDSLA
jgi:4a-hydroxytetrahydrobiopterin dehydratase